MHTHTRAGKRAQMHTLHMHWHVHVCSPFHLTDASSFHYSFLRFSLFFFLLQPVPHAPSILLSLSLSFPLAFTFRLVHNPCCSQCLHLFAKPITVLEIVSKAHRLPPQPQPLPPTFLRRAQQTLLFHNERAAEVGFMISDGVLITLAAAQAGTVSVVSCALVTAELRKRALWS